MSDQTKPTYENVGHFWEKVTAAGVSFLAGRLVIDGKEHAVTIWPNKFKKSSADTRAADYFAQIATYAPEPVEDYPF